MNPPTEEAFAEIKDRLEEFREFLSQGEWEGLMARLHDFAEDELDEDA